MLERERTWFITSLPENGFPPPKSVFVWHRRPKFGPSANWRKESSAMYAGCKKETNQAFGGRKDEQAKKS
jgi:hypothetical protein